MLGGHEDGEPILKAQIKEEGHVISEMEPVISAPADSLSCALTYSIHLHTLLVIAFNVSQAVRAETANGPFLGSDCVVCWCVLVSETSAASRADGGHNCVGPDKSFRLCNIQVSKHVWQK